jgi:uroporphyrinogen decarboxylase
MNQRGNLLSLLRRTGYEFIPCQFSLTPHLVNVFHEKTGYSGFYEDYFDMPWRNIPDIKVPDNSGQFLSWYPLPLKEGTKIDEWGIAHEPGSAEAMHMTRMLHPLQGITDFEKIREYPFPKFEEGDGTGQRLSVEELHKQGLAAVGNMPMTIWETSWYIRSMEDLMMDMMGEEPAAEFILDAVTEQAVIRAL